GMMADVFGQMLGQPAIIPGWAPAHTGPYPAPPQFCPPPPCPVQVVVPYPVQPSVYVPAPQATAPAPATMPAQPGTLQRSLTGAWYRELGSKQCVVKIAADHFTVTVSEASEIEDGKTMTGSMTLTAEYRLLRDGTTAVGLITSVDMQIDGDVPD